MSLAKFTLYGFQEYLEANNDSLFAYITLPFGMNKQTLEDTILLKGGEFEPLYANPLFMKDAIGNWNSKWSRTIDKWWTALNISYNPLENYDRFEDYTDTTTLGTTHTTTNNLNQHDVFTDTSTPKTEQTSGTTVTTTNKRSAYDSADFQNHDQTVASPSGSDTTQVTANGHTDSVVTNTGTVAVEGSGSDEFTHTARLHGNIGVTTSQQMLQSELDIAQWNIYEQIADLFISELCIMIY